GGIRAERALVGAATGRDDGHVPAPADAEAEAVVEIVIDGDQVPARARDRVERADAAARRGRDDVGAVAVGDAGDGGEVPGGEIPAAEQRVEQLADRFLALAPDDDVDGGAIG